MARFYGKRVVAGTMTIEEVPLFWRKAAEKWLKENGYGTGSSGK